MGYKQTVEYAYDVLQHFYDLHENQILSLGKDNIKILVPEEIYRLLAVKSQVRDLITGEFEIIYPEKFHKIELKSYSGSEILFVLKEIK